MISNICRANFNGGRTAQGNNRFQWDYGQILEISGIENLPDPFTAQFSNYPVLGTAKTAVGTGGRVEIPNEYFVSGQNIYCFIVLHTDEDDGRTVYIATIPVTKRPKPIDDPITPTQQSTIDTAIAALQAGIAQADQSAQTATEQAGIAQNAATTATEAAETAEGAVADVEAAATRAETAADGAEASATAAEASATDAETAKTEALAAKGAAETAAANAEQSATDAGNYAGLAEEAETSAAASATAAEASATSAAESATAASGSASQAAQKASEAASSATAASTSATNAEAAKTGAEAAQTAAETAQASAEEAAESAEQSATTAEWYAERVERFLPTDTASGEIASFPDGADSVPTQSVIVSMEPIQDLHGYDHPWPAGGGKNRYNSAETVWASGVLDDNGNPVSTTASHYTQNFTAVNAESAYILSGSVSSPNVQICIYFYTANKEWISRTSGTSASTCAFTTPTNCSFIRVQVGTGVTSTSDWQIESGSTPTDFAPYENLCPISGRTGADIEHTGVNVWDEETELGQYNNSTGLPISANDCIRTKNPIPVKPNVTYYTTYGNGKMQVFFYKADETYLGNAWIGTTNLITTPDGCALMRFRLASAYGTTYGNDISINYPATDTAYHAYTGDTISVTFPSEAGTVYGCTLGVVSGELVVDRAMVDLGTLNWNYVASSAFNFRSFELIGANAPETASTKPNAVCSILPVLDYTTISTQVDGITIIFATSTQAGKVWAHSGTYTDATAFKTAVTGQTLVYELATPITYHLTPQEVRTLLGANNVWSDAGETAVTYKADVQLYIDKKLA